ncbi:MAG: hypothetical protein ABSE69_05870 [Roseiarcus sp.]
MDDAALARFGDPGREKISLFSMIDCLASQIFQIYSWAKQRKSMGFDAKNLDSSFFGFCGSFSLYGSTDWRIPESNITQFKIFRNKLSRPAICRPADKAAAGR